ncbi:MAG: alpha/beta hydrolase [Deltaproteobacteria bacterium]|nr:alpha/beta hydrolase [Deltaproteobacteria bacterium]
MAQKNSTIFEPQLLPGLLRESLTVLELPRLAWALPNLLAQPRGNGEPVLVLPGFSSSDTSTIPLRSYLSVLGYEVRGWGLGVNRGDVRTLVPRVIDIALRWAQQSGQRVRLIGWSLGGVLARETAREKPDSIERVITLGTPVVGGPKYTTAARVYRRRGHDLDAIEESVAERNRIPIDVPITAIYTRGDGVVAWQACIDDTSPGIEHCEITSTHIGLGISAEVYRIIAQRLARSRNTMGPANHGGEQAACEPIEW